MTQVFAQSQRQSTIWYFGNNAGLDFTSGTPIPLLNGAMQTSEGCASIADQQGNLLFYTDGLTVFNRHHQPMPNGTGLLGNSSTAQAAVIVPAPANPQWYYVFTNTNNARPNGLTYSLVDMTQDSGAGNVIQKNTFLFAPTSEMVTAVRHQNQQAYWVMTHENGSNAFRAYLVTSAGVSPTAVISRIGTTHAPEPTGNTAIGCMKFSPDGKKLAVASFGVGAEVYDFNAATGEVSNPIRIPGFSQGYGVEFSPDGSLLYITTGGNTQLLQVDLKAGSPASVAASKMVIANIGQDGSTRYVGGSLQLGPDGKLYVARPTSAHLGVVQKPNLRGAACTYVDQGLYLGGKTSMCGLPVFLQSLFYYDGQLHLANTCFGDVTQFTLDAPLPPSPVTTLWNFGDPASGAANTSSEVAPSHRFTAPGTYTVKLTRTYGTTFEEYTITFVVNPLPAVNLGPDRNICPGSSTVLDATLPNATAYRWSNGNTQAKLTVNQPGTYWVDVTVNGCTTRDEVTIGSFPVPAVELGPDRQLCQGETLLLDVALPNTTYRWQDGSTNSSFLVTAPGRYEVTLTNAQGCSTTDAVTIGYKPLPIVNLGPDRVLCAGDPLVLGAAQANATYKWQDGSTSATFSPTRTGTYWQEVTINGCTSRDEVNVLFNPVPQVNLGRDTTLCDGQTLLLNMARANATFKWQNGSTQPTFTVSQAGTYWVDVTNELNCTTRDEIKVHYLTPPAIELGNDTTLCYGDTLTIGQILPNVTYLWQDGSTKPTFAVTRPGTYRVTASLQHCSQTDVITVKFKDCVGGLFIPNIITPNHDGVNDNFYIMGLQNSTNPAREEQWELSVYDRWGKRLYHTRHYQNDWQGEGLMDGVYFYHLVHSKDGRLFKGWVEIVR
ncbi:T9SS C-terminal target domain-containing protein [Rufibacter radiotolerans]|uniref:T9SS C-terminal target domain-containing protein n=1 Tax=Rufibacter radiotolerans TaxID=1379910 RepID=UPI000664587E|nr:T9SS C-terminal target domain-containing protein [Rufibacter radiotolerans]